MELPEQLVFAYQHNAFDARNFGKVDGHNRCRMVDFDRFEYTVAHYLQRFFAQILGILVGIAVVGIAPAMVVKHVLLSNTDRLTKMRGNCTRLGLCHSTSWRLWLSRREKRLLHYNLRNLRLAYNGQCLYL